MRAGIYIIGILLAVAIIYVYLYRIENFSTADPNLKNHMQDRFNILGQSTNPVTNPAAPIGIPVSNANALRKMSMVGLNSYVQRHSDSGGLSQRLPGGIREGMVEGFRSLSKLAPTNTELNQYTSPPDMAHSVPISDSTSMLAMEKFCREYDTTKGNPFSDATFAENCGVCLSTGRFNDVSKTPIKETASGTGVLVYKADKKKAYDRQRDNNYMYPRAMPSLARAVCVGATSQDNDTQAPTLAIDANMYMDIKRRKECIAAQDFAPDRSCGQCVTNPKSWSYVKNPPAGDLNRVYLVLVGSGLVTITVNGKQLNRKNGSPVVDYPLSATPRRFNLGRYMDGGAIRGYIEEGDKFVVTVKGAGAGTVPHLGGLIQSIVPNGGKYVEEFYNTIVTDGANAGNAPRVGQPKLFVSTYGVYVRRIVPTTPVPTPVSMILNCQMPLTFINPMWNAETGRTQIASYDCKNGPYVNSAEDSALLMKDECTGQKPGSISIDCLHDIIMDNGCSTGGDWYMKGLPTEAFGTNMMNSIGQIASWIQGALATRGDDPAVMKGCYGVDTSSPCDGLGPGDTPSAECLAYLYSNTSEQNPRVGKAYTTVN